MNGLYSITEKMDSNLNMGYSLIRIFLGAILFVRGFFFLTNPEAIMDIASQEQTFLQSSYIAFAHLIGGAMILLGLFARIGALIQLPIMFGAVFLIHGKDDLMMGGQSFELAVLVFFLLAIILVFGSGPYALQKFPSRRL